MQLVLSLVYFLLFCWLIRQMPFFRNLPGLSFPILVFYFGMKIIAGMVLIYIYTYYYTDPLYADVYKYFNDGRIMFMALYDNPFDYLRLLTGIDASAPHLDTYYDQMTFWNRPYESLAYNDNRLVIRFNAFAFLFSMGSIWVHNVFINVLSFSGMVALYRFFATYSDQNKLKWLGVGVFLFPSLLFWGSGILKEALLIWSFGFWIFHFDRIITHKNRLFFHVIVLLIYSFILLLLKPYTILLWLPCMIAFYISRNYTAIRINFWYILILLGFVTSALLVGYFFPSYDFLKIIASKQNDFIAHSLYHDAGSLIHTHKLSPVLTEMVKAFFIGFFHSLFRPHLLDIYSFVTLMAALENAVILLIILYTIIRFDRKSLHHYPVKWAGLWFTILMFGFVGMISVAFGGIVRYKIPALPFLWVFLIHITTLPELRFSYLKNKLMFWK